MQKNKLTLAVAIVLGVITALVLHSYMNRIKQSAYKGMKLVRVVVAKKNIAEGALLEKSFVASRKIPAKFLPAGAVFAKDYELILGQQTQVPLRAGDLIHWSYLGIQEKKTFSAAIPEGKRAITIGVDQLTGVGGMITVYDHVDILMTFTNPRSPNAEASTITLLNDIVVLAVGQTISEYQPISTSRSKRGYSSVTLCLSPVEAELIIFAQEHSRLCLSLRNPEDRETGKLPEVNFNYLNDILKTVNIR